MNKTLRIKPSYTCVVVYPINAFICGIMSLSFPMQNCHFIFTAIYPLGQRKVIESHSKIKRKNDKFPDISFRFASEKTIRFSAKCGKVCSSHVTYHLFNVQMPLPFNYAFLNEPRRIVLSKIQSHLEWIAINWFPWNNSVSNIPIKRTKTFKCSRLEQIGFCELQKLIAVCQTGLRHPHTKTPINPRKNINFAN